MAKDPAFLFYPNDWIGGTMGMSFEEKGAYLELLLAQFNRGHMTIHMITQIVGQQWKNIQDKFIQDESGLWYNVRLEEEQHKRKEYSKSRRNNLSGKNQHIPNPKKPNVANTHMTHHMENEDENGNETRNVNVSLQGKKLSEIEKNERFEAVSLELKSSQTWLESVSILISKSPEYALKLLDEFLIQIRVAESYTRNIFEIKQHFSNWVKKQQCKEDGTSIEQIQNFPTI